MGKQGNTKGARARAAERRGKALELRKAGASYRQIGAQLDVSMAQAHRDVTRAIVNLAKLSTESAKELRTLEEGRLDTLLLSVWQAARAGDLQAIDRALRIMARRAKLLGLDAPQKLEIHDWRKEARERGIDPASIFEQYVKDAVVAIEAGAGATEGRSVAGGDTGSKD